MPARSPCPGQAPAYSVLRRSWLHAGGSAQPLPPALRTAAGPSRRFLPKPSESCLPLQCLPHSAVPDSPVLSVKGLCSCLPLRQSLLSPAAGQGRSQRPSSASCSAQPHRLRTCSRTLLPDRSRTPLLPRSCQTGYQRSPSSRCSQRPSWRPPPRKSSLLPVRP